MHYHLRVICLLLAALYSLSGRAESCYPRVGQMTLNLRNLTYQPTLPVNSQMTSQMADNGSGVHFSCDLRAPQAAWKRIVYRQKDTSGGGRAINGRHVFASNLAGMGYSIGFQCSNGAVRYIGDHSAPAGSESVTVCDSDESGDLLTRSETVVKMFITFYKTGEIFMSGGNHTNTGGQSAIGELFIQNRSSAGQMITSSPVSIDLAALNIDSGAYGSCQVENATINVDMGAVNRAEFSGPGSAAGSARTFTIPVRCSSPTGIRIGFFGLTSNHEISDTLALTKAVNAASGVGIRLKYGNNIYARASPLSGSAVNINQSTSLPLLKNVSGGKPDARTI